MTSGAVSSTESPILNRTGDPPCRGSRRLRRGARFTRCCRVVARLVWLGGELALAALRIPRRAPPGGRGADVHARARWLQEACRRVLRVFGVRLRVQGTVPTTGLLVCNHLGYLDVLVLGALAPAVFVAKHEVQHWPGLGWFARAAGTVFVRRNQRRDVLRANATLETLLDGGALVVLFPEGTSTDGRCLLPFKSSLLAPALRTGCPVWVGRLAYALADGAPEEEVCYWGAMTLLPHLLNLLGKRGVGVTAGFAGLARRPRCRKVLAVELHTAVQTLPHASEPEWRFFP